MKSWVGLIFFVLTLLSMTVVLWHGFSLPLFVLGVLFTIHYKHVDLAAGFFASYFFLAFSVSLLGGASFFSAVSLLNFLWIFILLPEPKTSPMFRLERIVYGAVAAVLLFVFRELTPAVSEFSALAVVNVFALFLHIWTLRRRAMAQAPQP